MTHHCAVPLHTASWLKDIFVLGTGVDTDCSSYLKLNVGHIDDSSAHEPDLEQTKQRKANIDFFCLLFGCLEIKSLWTHKPVIVRTAHLKTTGINLLL